MAKESSEVLLEIINSINHPFYVIEADTYKIKFANKACGFGDLDNSVTCHMRTHKSAIPCSGEHVCPLLEVKKSGGPVRTEHIHYDSQGNPRNMEVHGDPVFDENGKVVMMIEYAFDITDRVNAEEKLNKKIGELEKYNKVMLGREKRVIELKREVDELLSELGRPAKYKIH